MIRVSLKKWRGAIVAGCITCILLGGAGLFLSVRESGTDTENTLTPETSAENGSASASEASMENSSTSDEDGQSDYLVAMNDLRLAIFHNHQVVYQDDLCIYAVDPSRRQEIRQGVSVDSMTEGKYLINELGGGRYALERAHWVSIDGGVSVHIPSGWEIAPHSENTVFCRPEDYDADDACGIHISVKEDRSFYNRSRDEVYSSLYENAKSWLETFGSYHDDTYDEISVGGYYALLTTADIRDGGKPYHAWLVTVVLPSSGIYIFEARNPRSTEDINNEVYQMYDSWFTEVLDTVKVEG